jgi:hypothetical protein
LREDAWHQFGIRRVGDGHGWSIENTMTKYSSSILFDFRNAGPTPGSLHFEVIDCRASSMTNPTLIDGCHQIMQSLFDAIFKNLKSILPSPDTAPPLLLTVTVRIRGRFPKEADPPKPPPGPGPTRFCGI